MKIVNLVVDADYAIFTITEGKNVKSSMFPTTGKRIGKGKKYKEPLKPYKDRLKEMIRDLEETIAVEVVAEDFKIGTDTKVIFSDPDTNFRYDLYPEYKANRKTGPERSKLFYRLRKWAHKKYTVAKDFEADDLVAYYVREEGYLGVSFDKDLIYGVPGIWYNPHYMHKCIVKTDPYEADRFTMLQTLAGDPTDNIKGIKGVGIPTAQKLLNDYGWDWNGIRAIYSEKGMTEDDAILTRRLVGMDQLKKTKKGWKLRLWKPQK